MAEGAAVQKKLPMGELEARVMDVLWDRGGWLSPGEVHDVLAEQRPLAYTTVMTILVRLWQKQRLERQRDGRAYVYKPLRSREECAAMRMSGLLVGVEDRPAALARFLETLPAADRDQMRRMLRSRART